MLAPGEHDTGQGGERGYELIEVARGDVPGIDHQDRHHRGNGQHADRDPQLLAQT
jgi:hypothetical protein